MDELEDLLKSNDVSGKFIASGGRNITGWGEITSG
jgi:hypothetical protein